MVSARTAEALIGAAVKPFRGEGRRTIAAAVAAAISVVWDKLNKEKGLVQNSGKQWVRRPDGRAALHQATAQQSAGKNRAQTSPPSETKAEEAGEAGGEPQSRWWRRRSPTNGGFFDGCDNGNSCSGRKWGQC